MPDWTAPDAADALVRPRPPTNPVIEQAKGILMARHGYTPEEAFDLLRRASQRANIKVSVLAASLVEQVVSPKGPNVPEVPVSADLPPRARQGIAVDNPAGVGGLRRGE